MRARALALALLAAAGCVTYYVQPELPEAERVLLLGFADLSADEMRAHVYVAEIDGVAVRERDIARPLVLRPGDRVLTLRFYAAKTRPHAGPGLEGYEGLTSHALKVGCRPGGRYTLSGRVSIAKTVARWQIEIASPEDASPARVLRFEQQLRPRYDYDYYDYNS